MAGGQASASGPLAARFSEWMEDTFGGAPKYEKSSAKTRKQRSNVLKKSSVQRILDAGLSPAEAGIATGPHTHSGGEGVEGGQETAGAQVRVVLHLAAFD